MLVLHANFTLKTFVGIQVHQQIRPISGSVIRNTKVTGNQAGKYRIQPKSYKKSGY